MSRKVILSLFLLAASVWSVTAGAPVSQRVTGVVSVSFPAPPRETRVGDQQNYLYETDTCAWLAQAKPYQEDSRVHDSVTLASFYDGMAKGILRAAKGTQTHRSDIRINGLQAMEIEYVKGDSRSLPSTVCSRAMRVNGDVVIVSFTAPTQLYDKLNGERDKFFKSITFDHDSTLYEYEAHATIASTTATDSMPSMAAGDSIAAATTQGPATFMDSHAGSVIKMFGMLVLVCALIYAFAVYTRRKG